MPKGSRKADRKTPIADFPGEPSGSDSSPLPHGEAHPDTRRALTLPEDSGVSLQFERRHFHFPLRGDMDLNILLNAIFRDLADSIAGLGLAGERVPSRR